jgi:hypothetical protein
MRIVSRTTRQVREQQREKSLRKREAAGTLATMFPRSELVPHPSSVRFEGWPGARGADSRTVCVSAGVFRVCLSAWRLRR